MILSYGLYDTADFGTSANTEHTLFQNAQGSSSTQTKSKTNMRGSGSLPSNESFTIEEIHISSDFNLTAADYQNMWIDSYIEVRISDDTVLLLPLKNCASMNAFSGTYTQASAADEAVIGLMGNGLKLSNPITINGGESFRVSLYQGTALSAATGSVKCVLYGTLDRP